MPACCTQAAQLIDGQLCLCSPAGNQTLAEMPRGPGAVAPAVGIPNSVPDQPTAAKHLFFATIVPPDQAVRLNSRHLEGQRVRTC